VGEPDDRHLRAEVVDVPATLNLADQDWRAMALCARSDPDLFFAPGALEHKLAKRVCRHCPVRKQCLAYAMDAPVDHGIWGGLTERERRRYRRLAGDDGWRVLLDRSA
jgi:WhiB family transcriptional regulator, redox-sensing transcriptional regulator